MPSLAGTTVVVTGANSGLGYEGSKAFAAADATVVMACRSLARGQEAAEEIRSELLNSGAEYRLDVRECDLGDLNSVASFADGVHANYDAVDILCNNAGVMAIPRSETDDGFETQLGVNHFGHFALTGRLFPLLAASDGEARVVTQSSGAHEFGEMDFTDLNWEESYDKWDAYGRSKLANLLFAYELQRKLDEHGIDDVTSVGCHPGYAATGLQGRTARESWIPFSGVFWRLANLVLAQSAEQGAWPMLYAATADLGGGEYVGPSGFGGMRGAPERQESNDASRDEEDARRLWERSVEDTGVSFQFEEVAAEA
jgi:hypothetical protein